MNDLAKPSGLRLTRSPVLVGMMGCGKSSVGAELARFLGLEFADSDALVESAAGQTIPAIFAEKGEAAFRDLEHQIISRLLAGPVQVIATGGGAFVQPRNQPLFKTSAISIWLNAPLALLQARTDGADNRPLQSRMAELLAAREPVYATADIIIGVDDRPVSETAQRVLDALRQHVERAA